MPSEQAPRQVLRVAVSRALPDALVGPRRHLRRVIEVTGLREELALHETLDEALGLPRRATCSPLGALGYRES